MSRILLRVDRVGKMSSRDADECLGRFEVEQAPDIGDVLAVCGEPFFVVERGWAVETGAPSIYCYVRVAR